MAISILNKTKLFFTNLVKPSKIKINDQNYIGSKIIEISSGDIEVRESCNDINSKSGDIKAVTILGNVKTISGNISYKNNLN